MEFKGRANVVEVNRYHFIIEAETKEEAQEKLEEHLKKMFLFQMIILLMEFVVTT